MAKQKPQKFKLGEKATSFYDPVTRKKVLPGQKVEFTPEQQNTTRFKDAKNGGHLVIHDSADDDAKEEALAKFNKLDTKKKIKKINETWELTEDQSAKIAGMSDDELNAYYAELLEGDDEDEDDSE